MNDFIVAICDDEDFYIEDTCQYFKAYQSEREVTFHVEKFHSGVDLLRAMREERKRYDLILLDVDMPLMNGVDTATEIRKDDAETIICFITNYDRYAYNAYEVNAVGYLLKPVSYVKLKEMFDRCIREIRYLKDRQTAQELYLEVPTGGGTSIVPINHILYFEKRRNQCIIHMTEKEITCYETLAHISQRLDKSRFLYTHQGFIVNFDYIKEVLPDRVFLEGNLDIPVSRRYYKSLRRMHMDKIYRLRSERRKTEPQT